MAQRNSGHARIERDAYMTPAWVTEILLAEIAGGVRLPCRSIVWECAAGTGQMVAAIESAGLSCIASDVAPASNNMMAGSFLDTSKDAFLPFPFDAIITNPPYKDAEAFVRRALDLTEKARGLVAMLLPVAFDSAKGRMDLFEHHPAWGRKIVLVDRIMWIEPEFKEDGPSENHAWFVWDWRGTFGRSIAYRGAPDKVLADLARHRRTLPSKKSKAAGAQV